jgi:hypothetical protein
MERGLVMVLLAAAGAPAEEGLRAARQLAAGYVVDRLEGPLAVVVPLGGGEAVRLSRSALPRRAREGDVVVGGRVEQERREALRRRVASTRARLRQQADEPPASRKDALTAGGER